MEKGKSPNRPCRSSCDKWEKCRFYVIRTKSVSAITRHGPKSESGHFRCESSALEPFQCQFCDFQTDLKVRADRHRSLVHGNGHSSDPEVDLKVYGCGQCSFETHSALVFAGHVCVASDSARRFKCEKCRFKTDVKDRLIRHQLNQHVMKRVVWFDWFKCKHCPYTSQDWSTLKQHFVAKHERPENIRWKQCEQCSFRTKRGDILRRHVACVHGPPEWFECEQCPFRTKRRSRVKEHVSYVHGCPDWLECGYCSFRTKSKNSWREHVKYMHESTKWFECEQCSFRTKRKWCLNQHVTRLHVSPQWYQCSRCPYRSRRKNNWKRHELTQHPTS